MKKDILQNVLFKDIIEHSNDMVWILKIPELSIEYVNQTTCNEMGYTLEEMQALGMGKLRKSLPDAVSFSDHINELKETDEGMTDYAILIRRDGSEFYIEVKARIIEIEGSTYNLAIVRNITDRIEMIQKIEEESNRAQSYLNISKVIIMTLDNDKKVTMINQAGCDLLGYTKEELIGENFIKKCIPDDIRNEVDEVAESLITLNHPQDSKINEVITKNGEKKLISWKNTTLKDTNDNPLGVLTSGEDITDLMYTQRKLLQKSKQAQMGEMLNMIAHQWRQPLASISSHLISLKLKEELNMHDKKFSIETIDNASDIVQHLSKTIDDFGNFFKEDKEKNDTTLDLLVEDALKLIQPIFKNNEVSIEKNYNFSQEISLYKNEIVQVIMNLFKNAIDAFKEREIKKPKVMIKTYSDNGKYCLSISDNAGGIEPQIFPKIFNPYFTTKSSLNGTGIGLYMSRKMVEESLRGKLHAQKHRKWCQVYC